MNVRLKWWFDQLQAKRAPVPNETEAVKRFTAEADAYSTYNGWPERPTRSFSPCSLHESGSKKALGSDEPRAEYLSGRSLLTRSGRGRRLRSGSWGSVRRSVDHFVLRRRGLLRSGSRRGTGSSVLRGASRFGRFGSGCVGSGFFLAVLSVRGSFVSFLRSGVRLLGGGRQIVVCFLVRFLIACGETERGNRDQREYEFFH